MPDKTFLLFICLFFAACNGLNEASPDYQVPYENAISDLKSANAAINGIYDAMQDKRSIPEAWFLLAQLYSDELTSINYPSYVQIRLCPSEINLDRIYGFFYQVINNANNAIDLIPRVSNDKINELQKNDLIAQARCLRAFSYLNLINYFESVPLVLYPTRETGNELYISNSSSTDIYQSIINDLEYTIEHISAQDDPFLISKNVALALLARTHLYQENWSTAKEYATLVLGNGFNLTDYAYLDDQIFTLGFFSGDFYDINEFFLPNQGGNVNPTDTLIKAYEPGDIRFVANIDTSSFALPFGIKYPSLSGSDIGKIYFIRHAEMVLILAEAEAELNDFQIASDWINQVRQRAALPPVSLNSTNYIDIILKERFTEFAFETPFRMIDLRRKGKSEEVLSDFGYDPCDAYWPLPQQQLDLNPNLIQNDFCGC